MAPTSIYQVKVTFWLNVEAKNKDDAEQAALDVVRTDADNVLHRAVVKKEEDLWATPTET